MLCAQREATWVYCTCYNLNSDRYFQYNSTENPLVHCVVSFLVWSTLLWLGKLSINMEYDFEFHQYVWCNLIILMTKHLKILYPV